MTRKLKKTDPSDVKQLIPDVHVNILCSRYWMLNNWEGQNLSAPFWRLYYNTITGGELIYKRKTYELTDNFLVLIPPNTRYSTHLKGQENNKRENIDGRRIELNDNIRSIEDSDAIDHLFIHFNLGVTHNQIKSGVYFHKVDTELKNLLQKIKDEIILENRNITLSVSLMINLLIITILKDLPQQSWGHDVMDKRVLNAMTIIRNNSQYKINNEELADASNMAVNSFARLFRDKSGMTIQQYVQKTRIEKACDLMHHTTHSIDDIAIQCGFFDRHHFSKVFKQCLNITPAYYMKNHTLSHE